MQEIIFQYLEEFNDILWGYVALPVVVVLGLYLTVKSGFIQIKKFPKVVKTFYSLMKVKDQSDGTIHPLKAFFAAVGGCVGIGNIVGVCTAIKLGGPGALLWIWVAATAGMVIKYAEVYLGMRFRVGNSVDGFKGGPMYFLRRGFKTPFISVIISLLLCIYGVEVYQFSIVVDSVVQNYNVNIYVAISTLLVLVIFAGAGGIRRVGNISSAIIPLFVLLYAGMGIWVVIQNYDLLPAVLGQVLTGAFTGHAAIGGFVGSTIMLTISQGVRFGCYTGDVGVGYASVIHSESSETVPERQASLAIFGIFLDTFVICTTSVMIILVTGVWAEHVPASMLVQKALGLYFPYMEYFMPFFLFLLGYSTINAYFVVGLTCADFLNKRWGRPLFYSYAVVALVVFSLYDSMGAFSLMSMTGALLLIINSLGIYRLRKEISFNLNYPLEEVAPGPYIEEISRVPTATPKETT